MNGASGDCVRCVSGDPRESEAACDGIRGYEEGRQAVPPSLGSSSSVL